LSEETKPARSGSRVSVVIPAYNQSRFVVEAIESVRGQDYPSLELIVVDDGSTDDTPALLRRYSDLKAIRQENRGLAAARNKGLEAGAGDLVLFLDADDRLRPDAVAALSDELERQPGAAFAAGLCQQIDIHGRLLPVVQRPKDGDDPYLELLREAHIWMPGAVLYRRKAVEQAGGFDTKIDAAADYDLYLKLARRHPVRLLDRVVGEYRQHSDSMSRSPGPMLAGVMTALRRHRDVRRRGEPYRLALAEGIDDARGYFGRLLVVEAHDLLARRRWRGAGRALALLLRYHPRGFWRVVRGVSESNRLEFHIGVPGEQLMPPVADPPPIRPGGLRLSRLYPAAAVCGEPFNVQADGEAALAAACENAGPATRVVFAGRPLRTIFAGPDHLTATVPRELYSRPGSVTVYLQSLDC
jgi:glycosyltransferase involved in cell wall biosynthesis